ncbi:hypothetical protein PVL29_017467 [Vitis rotundifolia]|uniref:Uncharacterized protein n=1 Tax=Vitis rotundifolia TaxID=103349 RepID=A0AA38ZBD6_VITRO|nr:hypothetical protein PVL29_017467 [Vitis rotundifolia]
MSEVKSIGAEFSGECVNPFASLKELRLVDMPEWESWSHSNLIIGDVGAFPCLPCLQRFVIRYCPKLIGELPKCLQSLVELHVSECPELVCRLPELASLRELNLKECDEAMLRGEFDPTSLMTLNLEMILGLACVRIGFTRSLVALQELVIKDCGWLTCLMEDCANLEKLPNGLQTFTCLEELQITRWPKLVISRFGKLVVDECESLKWLPQIYMSPSLVCFPNCELPTTLKNIYIFKVVKI